MFFSNVLVSLYLSKLFHVRYSVDLETANLHPRWRSLPFIVPPPSAFPLLATQLCFLGGSALSELAGPPLNSLPVLTKVSETLQPGLSLHNTSSPKVCDVSRCVHPRVLHSGLVFSHLAKRAVEKWMQQPPQPHLGLPLCFNFLNPAINQVSLLWHTVLK